MPYFNPIFFSCFSFKHLNSNLEFVNWASLVVLNEISNAAVKLSSISNDSSLVSSKSTINWIAATGNQLNIGIKIWIIFKFIWLQRQAFVVWRCLRKNFIIPNNVVIFIISSNLNIPIYISSKVERAARDFTWIYSLEKLDSIRYFIEQYLCRVPLVFDHVKKSYSSFIWIQRPIGFNNRVANS